MVRATFIILNQARRDIPVLLIMSSRVRLHSSSSRQCLSDWRLDISALVLIPSSLNLSACLSLAART